MKRTSSPWMVVDIETEKVSTTTNRIYRVPCQNSRIYIDMIRKDLKECDQDMMNKIWIIPVTVPRDIRNEIELVCIDKGWEIADSETEAWEMIERINAYFNQFSEEEIFLMFLQTMVFCFIILKTSILVLD